MQIGNNARVVLEKRYLTRDIEGNPTESVEGLFKRVASALAEPDKKYDPSADVSTVEEEFYELMTNDGGAALFTELADAYERR